MTESKKAPTATGAKKGKVKGTAQVTPKAADQEAGEVLAQKPPVAPAAKAGEGTKEEQAAWEAGNLASKRGTPNRPPLGYSNAEVKAWYRGYKDHANPQTGGPVDGITGGYRGDY